MSLWMLGSKTLGSNVLELQFVYVGKPWSKRLVYILATQSMFMCKVGIE